LDIYHQGVDVEVVLLDWFLFVQSKTLIALPDTQTHTHNWTDSQSGSFVSIYVYRKIDRMFVWLYIYIYIYMSIMGESQRWDLETHCSRGSDRRVHRIQGYIYIYSAFI
jgi:hypothetical protein